MLFPLPGTAFPTAAVVTKIPTDPLWSVPGSLLGTPPWKTGTNTHMEENLVYYGDAFPDP